LTGARIEAGENSNFAVQNSAVDFNPAPEFPPRSHLEGMNAKVEFIDPADKAAKRWIVAVELHK
jgi:hypothetical protein